MKYDWGTVIIVGLCCAGAFAFGGPAALIVAGVVLLISEKKK